VGFRDGGIVLGVEADGTDLNLDGRHIAHVVNPIVNQPSPPDGLQVSYQGSNSGEYITSGKSIRISTEGSAQIAGPSLYGYRAEESTELFENISDSGILITDWVQEEGLLRTKQLTPSDLGATFTFDFYDTPYNSLYINRNGTISFETPPGSNELFDFNENLPLQPTIAPLMEDFDVWSNPLNVYWEVKEDVDDGEHLIVQWDEVNFSYDNSDPDKTVTFQAVLYVDNGEIQFRYNDLVVSDTNYTDGKTATIGVGTDEFLYPESIPEGVFLDGVHLIESTDFYGAEDDFVRLAWETGGVAWNNDVISGSSGAYQTEFDLAFMQSIGDQIARKHATGDVAFPDEPLLQINIGGETKGSFIADTDPMFEDELGINFLLPDLDDTLIEIATQTILQNGNSMAGDQDTLDVFKTARSMNDADLELNLPANLVPNGTYVVELMLANLGSYAPGQTMNVVLKGTTMLQVYGIANDFAKIPTGSAQAPEYEVPSDPLGDHVPIVKRYIVDVIDGDGLQILLESANYDDPMINGLRILKVDEVGPQVTNVIISNSDTQSTQERYDFANDTVEDLITHIDEPAIGSGNQLRTVPVGGADTIEIEFGEDVNVSADHLSVTGLTTFDAATNEVTALVLSADGFGYNSDTFTAKWTFTSWDVADFYLISLDDSITDLAHQPLDGEWTNPASIYTENSAVSQFPSGDGIVGGDFNFVATILPGDATLDGFVDNADAGIFIGYWGYSGPITMTFQHGDFNGDGFVDSGDLALIMTNFNTILRDIWLLADLNGDYYVDNADAGILIGNFGMTGATLEDGDLNGDEIVDALDAAIMVSQFNVSIDVVF
jgi:nidogen-like/dockerin type I repeat protein